MTTITVNTDEVHALAQQGGKFIFKADAEQALLDLIHLKELLEEKIDIAKQMIAQAGETIDPNFKGVVGEHIKAIYRVYGEKYSYDKEFKEPLEEAGFLKKSEAYKVDSKSVDEYFEKHAALPPGIVVKERQKVISFVVSKDEKNANLILSPESVDARKDG